MSITEDRLIGMVDEELGNASYLVDLGGGQALAARGCAEDRDAATGKAREYGA